MSHTLSAVRNLPNHQLYKLKLVREHQPAVLVAVLTQTAIDLGVRFDNDRKDYRFNLSGFLGNNNGQWAGGIKFDEVAQNIKLDLTDRENRCLVADLRDMRGIFNPGMKYNLDQNLGLVDYFHPKERETYFRLGVKVGNISKRTLVLCFDGTSNHFSSRNTNVVKFFELLKKDDPDRQMVYYQTGVGTYTSPAWTNIFTSGIAKVLDLAVARYLYQHIIDGYKFLMETYRDGDQIYIFGFSRGAYTARALAGMLHCVGLLPRHNIEHVPFAYQIYASHNPDSNTRTSETKSVNEANIGTRANTEVDRGAKAESETEELESVNIVPDHEVSDVIAPRNAPLVGDPPEVAPPSNPLKRNIQENQFGALGKGGDSDAGKVDPEAYKQAFCTPIEIDFVGVWDTVGSVGVIIPHTLPYMDYNPSIRIFRHALALDECRANFVPSLWDHKKTEKRQDVREVWFRGQHTDVGGGSPPPTTTREKDDPKFTALSNISLRWMVQQCLENRTSIAFDRNAMELYRTKGVLEYRPAQPNLSLYRAMIKRTEFQSVEQKQSALTKAMRAAQEHRRRLYEDSSVLDKLDIKHTSFKPSGIFWKILEFFPSTRPTQTEDGPKMTHWPNLFKSRVLYRRNPNDPIFIHASVVNFLMTKGGSGYKPNVTWLGYQEGELPKIESFEGNNNKPNETERDALNLALKGKFKEAPGVWAQAKNLVASVGSSIGKLFSFSSSR